MRPGFWPRTAPERPAGHLTGKAGRSPMIVMKRREFIALLGGAAAGRPLTGATVTRAKSTDAPSDANCSVLRMPSVTSSPQA